MATALDPAKATTNGGGITLTNSNRTARIATPVVSYYQILSLAAFGGKVFYSGVVNSAFNINNMAVGLANATWAVNGGGFLGGDANGLAYYPTSGIWFNNSNILAIAGGAAGDTFDIAINDSIQKVWTRINGGNWNGDVIANQDPANNIGGASYAGIGAGQIYAALNLDGSGGNSQWTINFGQIPYTFAGPTGYVSFSDGSQILLPQVST